jgi:hypothetical protein
MTHAQGAGAAVPATAAVGSRVCWLVIVLLLVLLVGALPAIAGPPV